MDVHDVTNRDYLEFVRAGGYDREDLWSEEGWRWRTEHGVDKPVFWERRNGEFRWRGMFEELPLPPAWPVFVSHAEASAYARWRDSRLPTEPEFHRAAYGTPSGAERAFPWGDEPPDPSRANFDFATWDPVPVGSFPAGASAWGIHDLFGNGWEWTSTVFAPFPGFEPMPSYPVYSADFFDGKHFVMKGGSLATGGGAPPPEPAELVPGELPVRLCDLPDGERLRVMSSTRDDPDLRADPGLRSRGCAGPRPRPETDPVEVPLRRARLVALRVDLPAALVPDHAGGRATSRAARLRDGRSDGGPRDAPRARVRQRGEGRAPRGSAAQPAPARRDPPDRHLADGARALGADARSASSTSRSSATAPPTKRVCDTPPAIGPPAAASSSSSSARTSATSIRPPRRSSSRRSGARSAPATRCCSARTS